jgi:transforming growth factor-beta-induced protein
VHLIDTVVEANVVSLVDVAVSAGLSTLVSVVTSAGLAPTFSSVSAKGAFTLLAPTNAAFTALSTANANLYSWVTASKNVASLVTVLQYHAAAGAVFSRSLTNNQQIPMLNAQTLKVGIAGSVVTFTDNQATPIVATVTSADNAAYNGVAHVIDKVLLPTGLPYPASDIVTTAQGVATLSSLVTALTTASLVTALQAPTGPFTVFAPVNSAFSKLPPGLLTSVAKLTATLKLHVVPGRLYAADVIGVAASATPFLTTLNGDALSVTFVGGTVYLNGYAAITTPDVDTSNGVGESPPVAAHSRCALVRARREEERKRYRL